MSKSNVEAGPSKSLTRKGQQEELRRKFGCAGDKILKVVEVATAEWKEAITIDSDDDNVLETGQSIMQAKLEDATQLVKDKIAWGTATDGLPKVRAQKPVPLFVHLSAL